MPSRMRNRLLISLVVVSLIVISFNTSHAETTTYTYDELNRLIQVIYEDGSVVNYSYDASGNRITLTQTVDIVPPTGTIVINSGAANTYNSNVILTLTCSDNFACSQMQFSNDNVTYSTPEAYGTTKSWTLSPGLGIKIVYVKFKDAAGNWSTVYSDTIEYSGDWLSGWSYRKSVTLSRLSGLVTNYQMKLLVGESAGASGENVDCNGHIQAGFNDLRFTTSDGTTLLNYWIESITGTTPNRLATVWIKFDLIGMGATTFYMYYGKADAPTGSNGPNTFIAFDDFEDDIVGQIPSGWTEAENPANGSFVTITEGYSGKGARGVGNTVVYAAAGPTISPGTQSCIEAMVKFVGNGEFRLSGYRAGFRREVVATNFKYLTNDSPYWIDSGIGEDANWHKLKIMIYDINKVDYWSDANSWTNKNIYGSSQSWSYYGVRFQQTGTVDIDTVFIRNYRATEPAWGSWGNEEVYP